MAGIDKLRTCDYGEYHEFRLWCLRNNPKLLEDFYEPFMSYFDWNQLQHGDDGKLMIASFRFNIDKYLYWHCPLDFIREYLEKQCGYKKANWFVKLFWRD